IHVRHPPLWYSKTLEYICSDAACRVFDSSIRRFLPDKFTVALVQMSCGPEPADNLTKALDRVADAAKRGAHVVCLPELFQTQYICQLVAAALFILASTIPCLSTSSPVPPASQNRVVLLAWLF